MIALNLAVAAIQAASPTPTPPGTGIFNSSLLLSILVWTPVAVATGIAVLPNPRGRYDVLMKQIAFFTNLGLIFILWVAYNQFDLFAGSSMQFEENVPWLPAIGAAYHLGVDGPGMLMLILSNLVGIASVLASFGVRERVRSYFCLLLLSEACVNGAIVAHDMFVLLLFWGAATIPIALLILGWGGPRREAAAWRVVGYWGIGTVALLVAIMALYTAPGGGRFDMDVLLRAPLSPRVQLAVGAALIVAAATRLPLFPLHGWVREVYSEAPVGVSVVVAGSASRLGAYVLLRALVALPAGAQLLSPLLAAMAAITVVYAGLVVLRSTDLRYAAAHLAMVPGAITALGLAALSPVAIAGSVLSLFSGGLAAALIVGVCMTLTDRAQSRSLNVLSGLAGRMPNLTWLAVFAGLGLLGVPLMASFPAEAMTFFGAFRHQPVGGFAVAAGLAVVAAGVAVIAHRVLFGAPNPDAPGVSDASLGETWFLALLAGGLLWVGVFPSGPKLPGTDTPIFDPGLVTTMATGITDLAAAYTDPTP